MHGLVTSPHRLRQRQSARRHFRHGQRAAAIRATGARLYLAQAVPTLATAADSTGSNVAYIQAATILLRSDNAALVSEVLAGRVPILEAAVQMRRLVDLIAAYRDAKEPDRVAFARACGVETIFNTLVAAS